MGVGSSPQSVIVHLLIICRDSNIDAYRPVFYEYRQNRSALVGTARTGQVKFNFGKKNCNENI
jgi:hypothetical protein